MAMVNTVLGPVSPDQLGKMLIHEHLICGFPGWYADSAAPPFDREATIKLCLEAIEQAKGYGVNTIVDATPNEMGSDPDLVREVSEKSGVNIVCATGLYTEVEGAPAYFKFRGQVGADVTAEIYEIFVKDITQGIRGTGVKAGVIKVATGHGQISPYEEKVLRAAARAQKETGVPIITHTEAGTMGPEQVDLLISERVDPKRIMVGHIGNADLKYQTTILAKGAYIAFDRLGLDPVFPDALSKACVIGLIGIGYANRIMLSQDYIILWLGRPPFSPEVAALVFPNWSLVHILKNIIPALKEAGVTDEQVHAMMVENPRRLFAGG